MLVLVTLPAKSTTASMFCIRCKKIQKCNNNLKVKIHCFSELIKGNALMMDVKCKNKILKNIQNQERRTLVALLLTSQRIHLIQNNLKLRLLQHT